MLDDRPFGLLLDLESYFSRYNIPSRHALVGRLETVGAMLTDYEREFAEVHAMDDMFFDLEDMAMAAQWPLFEAPLIGVDPEKVYDKDSGATMNRNMFLAARQIALRGSILKMTGEAMNPFFTTPCY